MAHSIWKYAIPHPGCAINIPVGGKILHLSLQNNIPHIWVLIVVNVATVLRNFAFYGTGHTMPHNPGAYIGTVHYPNNETFHLFETT